ncbi:MAG: hypothetical protein IAE77_15380 [Prosthecobacter sp.]|jgi:hypothetical protein|uniref:hypothetical protein n=1 Tax=Prosthecobacter sp. TaxID=1965333 RepID=UPI0019F51AFD|nr:hypothetical protein [Prosthecobacter sp.]MBE2284841.1 hypothetical protein [Prosthecobacter sp.]
MKSHALLLGCGLFWLLAATCRAHPLPDVPVRANFEENGDWTLQVEIDPRCFEDDPNVAPYLTNADLAVTPAERKDKLKAQARDYIQKVVEIVLDPAVEVKPDYIWEFTGAENAELKTPEDPVMLTGTWRGKIPAGTTGYSIKALETGTLSVLYHNTALGKKIERYQILFPGENSYVLDLQSYKPRTAAPPPIVADEGAAAAVEAPCAFCGSGGDSYVLPVVVSVALIVALVTWLRRKRPV